MATDLKNILEELYQIDPELKQHETELITLIKKIIANKPDTKFDKRFAKRLKAQLLRQSSTSTKSGFNFFAEFANTRKLAFATMGIALIALVAIPVLTNLRSKNFLPQEFDQTQFNVTKLDHEAFGPLAATKLSQSNDAILKADNISGEGELTRVAGLGGAGFAAAAPSVVSMPAPDFVNYNYIYVGDELNLTDEQVEVYKRVKGVNLAPQASNLIKQLSSNIADLSKFNNAKLENATIVEDKSFGYIINIMFGEGMINIDRNWQKWPQINCTTEACFEAQRVRESDIPTDETLIKISDDFLKEYGISLSNYGAPEVQQTWLRAYAETVNKADFYFPEIISVVYPLKINNRSVYEQDGSSKMGLIINIDVKNKKVAGVSNLTTQSYQSSDYTAETDDNRILKIVAKGGINSWFYGDNQATVNIQVNTPKIELIRYYQYRDNQSQELLIPALIFPVIDPPTDQGYYRQNIVVPLVKELLDQSANQDFGGPIRIMVEPQTVTDKIAPTIAPLR
ncbi:MAG: hypothetical protein RB292_01175 [Patescibacteria group bacterium]|jgi:hypothetical protein|nr:hypothetical protein [Patescibacteria group bacterium]